MKNFKSIRDRILENPRVKKEYEKNSLQFDVAEKVMKARIKKEMTQKELAERIGTTQPNIARVESGNYEPTLKILHKISKALGTELILTFAVLENEKSKTEFNNYSLFLGGEARNVPEMTYSSQSKDSLNCSQELNS